jgi:hypothetical protein
MTVVAEVTMLNRKPVNEEFSVFEPAANGVFRSDSPTCRICVKGAPADWRLAISASEFE